MEKMIQIYKKIPSIWFDLLLINNTEKIVKKIGPREESKVAGFFVFSQ